MGLKPTPSMDNHQKHHFYGNILFTLSLFLLLLLVFISIEKHVFWCKSTTVKGFSPIMVVYLGGFHPETYLK